VGLEGRLEAFDELAQAFMGSEDETIRSKIGEKGKQILQLLTNEMHIKSANYYMKVMANIVKQGKEFAINELDRMKKMLKEQKGMAEDKLAWFRSRSNILLSFLGSSSSEKKEDL